MFKSFLKSKPIVSIFHHPSSPQSSRALALLKKSLTDPYPPGTANAKPLDFDLEVVEAAPTPDQVSSILSYLPTHLRTQSIESVFLSASHPTAAARHSSSESMTEKVESGGVLGEVAARNAKAVRWPIVVDWTGGRASVGDVDGVKAVLDAIRDGQK